ncbi:MAG: T9SS type A sorting domain-containing protein [Balneola sp.]
MKLRLLFVLLFGALIFKPLSLKAQELNSGKSPYPILFVHGLKSSSQIWEQGFWENDQDILISPIEHFENLGFKFGGVFGTELSIPQELNQIEVQYSITNPNGMIWLINFSDFQNEIGNQEGIYKQAKAIQLAIEELIELTGMNKVVLVGHSMGGLASAAYAVAKDFNGEKFNPGNVAKVLTLGSPFGGADSSVIRQVFGKLARDIERYSPATRDLYKSYNNHKNVFLFGGNENQVGTNFYRDVNYNRLFSQDEITGLREFTINDWGKDISLFWLVGSNYGEEGGVLCLSSDGDCVVDRSDQLLEFGEMKEIQAAHVRSEGLLKPNWLCAEMGSFDAIIEGLDEADDFEKAYEVNLLTSYSGFITHQGDRGTNPNTDNDYYSFIPSAGKKTKLTISKSPVFTSFYIYKEEGSPPVYSGSLSENSSRTFEFLLDEADGNSTYYLVIQGAAEASLSGLDDPEKTACDSQLSTARQPYFFRIDEEEISAIGQFSNYDLEPGSGNSDTPFSFSIDYKSFINHNIDLHNISLIVDDEEYEMTSEGTNIENGLRYSFSELNFNEGVHNYHFEAEHSGEIIRYPENSDLSFNVGQSATGWDASISVVDDAYLSPSRPELSENFSVTAKINNDGEFQYDEIVAEVKLIDPDGDIHDTDDIVVQNLSPNNFQEHIFSLSMPNSGEGQFKIDLNVTVTIDEDWDNNSISRSFSIGLIPNGTERYRAVTDDDIYIVNHSEYEDSFSFSNENNQNYTVELRSVDDDNGVQLRVESDTENYFSHELAIYPEKDIAVELGPFSDDFISFYGGQVELATLRGLVASDNVPQFEDIELYVKRGLVSTTDFNLQNGYDRDKISIKVSEGGNAPYEAIESWMTLSNLSGNEQRITWNIPTDAQLGRHEIYLEIEYDDHLPTYNKLYINVDDPDPLLSTLPNNIISTDDILTLSGNHFGTGQGKVYFNTVQGNIISWSEESIQVKVPEGITDGTIIVSRVDGATSNSRSYSLLSFTGDPIVLQEIPNQFIRAGDTLEVTELNNTFSDPNNDDLVFSSESDEGVEVLPNELSNGNLVLYADSSANGLYSVIITAKDEDDAVVADTFSVDVQGIITIPDLIYPEHNAVDIPLSFTFDWNSVDDATGYELHVSNSNNFDSLIVMEDGIVDTDLNSTNLEYQSVYYWRVRAQFGPNVGNWSDTLQFTTEAEEILPIIVSLPDTLHGLVGDTLSVPISIENSSEQFFEAFQFSIGYDSEKMKIFDIDTVGTLSSQFFLESNLNREGEILVNGATDSELNNSGTLLNLNVELLQPSISEVIWNNFSFNEGFPESITLNSVVSIGASQSCGDVTDNGSITNEDATFILRHVVELLNLSGEDSVRADVTGNGWISAYDASQVLRYVVGKEHIFNCGNQNAKIAYKPVNASYSWVVQDSDSDEKSFKIPISISSEAEYEAIDIEVRLSEGVTFDGLTNTPENWLLSKNSQDQKVLISMIGSEKPNNDKVASLEVSIDEAHGGNASLTSSIRVNDSQKVDLTPIQLQELPSEFTLSQNYPNPFNPTTNINFTIPEISKVELAIFNVLGQKVAELVNGEKSPGSYTISWDASSVSSGVYIYQLKTGNKIISKRMMLIK